MGLRTHLQARSKAEEVVAEADGQEGEEEEDRIVDNNMPPKHKSNLPIQVHRRSRP